VVTFIKHSRAARNITFSFSSDRKATPVFPVQLFKVFSVFATETFRTESLLDCNSNTGRFACFFLQNVHLYSSIMVKITSNIKKKKKKRKKDITQILTCRTHYFKVSTAQTDTIKLGKSKLNWYDGNLT